MRIGIITFHFVHNYGAILQAYALQQKLSAMGHEATIIDYRPQHHVEQYKRFNWGKLWSWSPYLLAKRLTVELLLYPTYRRKRKAFARFEQEHLHLTPYNQQQLATANPFDTVICGSDQIWEVRLQENNARRKDDTKISLEGLYYGDGIGCPVIAYAASYTTPFEGLLARSLSLKLQNFSAISTREESARQRVQALTQKKVHRAIDPVLLIGCNCFLPMSEMRPIAPKYVLLYEVVGIEGAYPMVYTFAKARGLEVVYLQSNYLSLHHIDKADQAASPEKFVAYIRHAEYVFTSSFHGTAFSLLFHKPFYYLASHSRFDNRSMSLLEITGLRHRSLTVADTPDDLPIDYETVDKLLEQEVEASELFIREALEHIQT